LNQFLLIHGGSHGAWCWERLVAELGARGYQAHAIDLPGHGADQTERQGVNRQSYIDAIVRHLETNDLKNIILVGHSLAGAVLPEVWNHAPRRVDKVIFLAALVLRAGEAPIDLIPQERRSAYYEMASQRTDYSFVVDAARARAIFYSDCSDEDAAQFFQKLTPQPFKVYLEVCSSDPQLPAHRVRYILCTEDRTLPEVLCRSCAEKLGVEVELLKSGHCSMLTQTKALADILVK
jgi:pimeloyl-ACP methyl ester carboxylesterase